MGIYADRLYAGSDTETWEIFEVYRQSAWQHWRVWVLDRASRLLIKARLENKIDDVLEWVHHRRCRYDCMTGEVSRRKPGSTAPRPMSGTKQERQAWMQEHFTTQVETYCGRLSLGAQIDVSLYYMRQQGRTELGRVEGEHKTRISTDQAEVTTPTAPTQG